MRKYAIKLHIINFYVNNNEIFMLKSIMLINIYYCLDVIINISKFLTIILLIYLHSNK